MATSASPNGLRAVNLIGGIPYSGSTRQIKIASGYAANVFYGDIVAITTASGTIVKVTATGADAGANAFPAGVIGVFVGCTYTDPNLGYKVFKQYWPTGTVASDAMAYVVDDDKAVFRAQADGSVAQAALGANICVVQGSGSTVTGNSAVSLTSASVATSTFLPFRIVGFVDAPGSAVGDTYTDCLVKFNTGIHSYTSATGV